MRWLFLIAMAAAVALLLSASVYNAMLSAGPLPDPESFRLKAVAYFDLTCLTFLGTGLFFLWSKPNSLLKWTAFGLYVPLGVLLLINVIIGGENVHAYRSWEIWKFTQYPISILMILVGLGIFLHLRSSANKD